MKKPKRDVARYIDETIAYELDPVRTEAPPLGAARGLGRPEAQLIYLSVRSTLARTGHSLKPEWHPRGAGGERKLALAYSGRGLPDQRLEEE